MEWSSGRLVVSPVERRIDHDAFGYPPGIIPVVPRKIGVLSAVHFVPKHLIAPVDEPRDGSGIRIEQQFRVVEAVTLLRLVGTVNPEAVKLSRLHFRHKTMPNLIRVLGHSDPQGLLR